MALKLNIFKMTPWISLKKLHISERTFELSASQYISRCCDLHWQSHFLTFQSHGSGRGRAKPRGKSRLSAASPFSFQEDTPGRETEGKGNQRVRPHGETKTILITKWCYTNNQASSKGLTNAPKVRGCGAARVKLWAAAATGVRTRSPH